MRHVMAYGTTNGGARDGMVVGKVTTHGTNRCSFEAASSFCTGTQCTQRDDQRENHQFRIHLASLKSWLGRLSVERRSSNWRDSLLTGM
jgi:hypothetical protein